jgi:hypothetical protein
MLVDPITYIDEHVLPAERLLPREPHLAIDPLLVAPDLALGRVRPLEADDELVIRYRRSRKLLIVAGDSLVADLLECPPGPDQLVSEVVTDAAMVWAVHVLDVHRQKMEGVTEGQILSCALTSAVQRLVKDMLYATDPKVRGRAERARSKMTRFFSYVPEAAWLARRNKSRKPKALTDDQKVLVEPIATLVCRVIHGETLPQHETVAALQPPATPKPTAAPRQQQRQSPPGELYL